jgi:hypothetical protein
MKLPSPRTNTPELHRGVEPASYPILFNLAECVHSDVSTVSPAGNDAAIFWWRNSAPDEGLARVVQNRRDVGQEP